MGSDLLGLEIFLHRFTLLLGNSVNPQFQDPMCAWGLGRLVACPLGIHYTLFAGLSRSISFCPVRVELGKLSTV